MSSSFDSPSFDLSEQHSQSVTSNTSETSGQYRIMRRARNNRTATPPPDERDITTTSERSCYSTPPTDFQESSRSQREATPAGDSPEATFSTPPETASPSGTRTTFTTPGTVMPGEKNLAISRINRGILRPSGTPGSGNGVRFFPKNKYRVITPNSSATAINVDDIDLEPVAKLPSSPAPPSFLDRLRATASHSFSFTSSAAPDSPGAFFTASARAQEDKSADLIRDDSWEAPGEEGEISLASASEASEFSSPMERMHGEDVKSSPPFGGEPSFDNWMASIKVPSQSPSLPTSELVSTTPPDEPLKEHDFEELSTRSMIVPDDMSNLMSGDVYGLGSQFGSPSISPTSDTSFSMQAAIPPLAGRQNLQSSPKNASSFLEVSDDSFDRSMAKTNWTQDETDTIQAQIPQSAFQVASTSPTSSLSTSPVSSPPAKTTLVHAESIKADASEAEMSVVEWHSTVEPSTPTDLSRRLFTPRKPSPLQQEQTEYFDVPSLMQSGSSPASFQLRTASATTSPVCLPASLRGPTRDLFAAHSSHTAALLKSLQIHQDLVRDLQTEVAERDNVLRELREEREDDLRESSDRERALSEKILRLERNAGSPSANPLGLSTRDLQIRLEKERHDVEDVRRDLQLAQEEIERLSRDAKLAGERAERAESAAREAEIMAAHRDTSKLDEALSRLAALEQENARLAQTNRETSEASVRAMEEIKRLTGEVEDAEERLAKVQDDAEEQHARAEDVAEARLAEQAEEYETRLREVAQEPGHPNPLQERVDELEEENAEWQKVIADIEADLESLRREHDAAKSEQEKKSNDLRTITGDFAALKQTNADQSAAIQRLESEVARLRADSSNKDLEIFNLHKRKAELKEDREMLNIALDSKQQEVELIKRKFAVRGVAGSTPLPSSAKRSSAETPASSTATPMPNTMRSRRRSSMAFVTPGMDRRNTRSVSAMAFSSTAPSRVLGESRKQPEVVNELAEPILKSEHRRSRQREAMLA